MKVLPLFVGLALTVSHAFAVQLLYEPFDYSNFDGPVTDNTPGNWTTGGTGANDLSVVAGSLSYAGLAPSIGNSVTNGGNGLGVRRLLGTTVNSGTVYFSALFELTAIGAGWSGNSSQVAALMTDNSIFALQVLVRSDGVGGYEFGVQKSGTGVTSTFDTTSFQEGATVFLVGSYNFDPESADVVSLWINPGSATFGDASPPPATITALTGLDRASVDRFNIRQNTFSGGTSVPEAMRWDELRVGTTWADVTPVPEPSTAAFLGLTLLGVVAGRRLRR